MKILIFLNIQFLFITNTIFISTSFKKKYIYDFELNLLSEEIDDYFKENTIIGIGD